MNEEVVLLHKNIGETPLEALEKLRLSSISCTDLPMTYAGRLDPLAEGLLLALVGDECHKKDEYLGLSKEYELSVLFGFETDTYDLLGLVGEERRHVVPGSLAQTGEESRAKTHQGFMRADGNNMPSESDLQNILSNFIGDISQSYPPYSSKPVLGKPLFQWAREGRLNEIEIPKHTVHIESIETIEIKNISKKDLEEYIENVIGKVKGDFRQKEILQKWQETLENVYCPESFPIVKLRIACGSGAYMRVLANDIGYAMGVPALAYHIKRTKIGEYSLK